MGFNKAIIISMLVVSLVFIAFNGFILSVSSNYNVTIDPEFNETFNRYAEANELVTDLDEIIEGGDVNPEGQDQAVYKNVIVAGKASRQGSELAVDMINEIPRIFGVDVALVAILSSILFLLMIFGFIGMISRRNP